MSSQPRFIFLALATCWMALRVFGAQPCRIEVVERETDWPVPLVDLSTTHQFHVITDNAGVAAIDAPELMDRDVFFHVASDGYEVPADGFGYRGVRLRPIAGQTLRVKVQRTMVARRLGRWTGAGLFAESQRTGMDLDWKESGVFGCDSVQTTVHQGVRYWLWGDTTLPQYPLGLFDSLGATSAVLPLSRFEPPLKAGFEFIRNHQGDLRGITPMPGDGPTWATAMTSLPSDDATARLVCSYLKIRNHLEEYECGLGIWNPSDRKFDRWKMLWSKTASAPKAPVIPRGHAVPWKDPSGRDWMLFGNPFPTLRIPARFEAWQDPSTWEVLHPQTELKDAATGEPVRPHSGGIGWHPWRKRWVTVFLQFGGKPSFLGELWYAESDAPTGPWGPAVKVLTHRHYTFYNPCLHLDFTPANSPMLLFEGTYTREFSGNPSATPRYDYNQILYRLDLDDSRLKPAQSPSAF